MPKFLANIVDADRITEGATNKLLTATERTKLSGIADGAEVNQNAFSNVAVSGQTTVTADAKTDTLTLVAGSNITITTSGNSVTITGAGGSGSPGGSNKQVQYNNNGAFGGATNAEIENNTLSLVKVATPTAPSTDRVSLFGRAIGGRMLPAFISPSGLDSALQPLLARNKIGWYNPTGNSTTALSGGIAVTGVGTATTSNISASSSQIYQVMRKLEYAVTTASTSAVAGVRANFVQWHYGSSTFKYGGFHFITRFGISRGSESNTTRRCFAGFSTVAVNPTDVDPSGWGTNKLGVGADSTDTNWQIMHQNGTSAVTKIDTGIAKSVSDYSEMFELSIFRNPLSTGCGIEFIRLSDGASYYAYVTTNVPTENQLLAWHVWASVGGTSSVIGVGINSIYIETDY